jgi:hypothetical protein
LNTLKERVDYDSEKEVHRPGDAKMRIKHLDKIEIQSKQMEIDILTKKLEYQEQFIYMLNKECGL